MIRRKNDTKVIPGSTVVSIGDGGVEIEWSTWTGHRHEERAKRQAGALGTLNIDAKVVSVWVIRKVVKKRDEPSDDEVG